MTETATVHPVRSVCRIREVIEGHSVLSEIYIGRYRSGGRQFRSVFVRATCSPVPDKGTISLSRPDHEVIEEVLWLQKGERITDARIRELAQEYDWRRRCARRAVMKRAGLTVEDAE